MLTPPVDGRRAACDDRTRGIGYVTAGRRVLRTNTARTVLRGTARAVACAAATMTAALALPAAAFASFPIVEYPTPTADSSTWGIALGSDGNVWFTENVGNAIGRITPLGQITEFPIPTADSAPQGIAAGPDGNLWFTESAGNKVGRITTTGIIKEFTVPIANAEPEGITAGPDGRLWFAEQGGNRIARITSAGKFAGSFKLPRAKSRPYGITAGPDGNLWFTESQRGTIGRITPTGTITEYPIGSTTSNPQEIAPGPDGNVWFTDIGTTSVGRVTPAGALTEFPAPVAAAGVFGIAPGPDGNMWYSGVDNDKIAQLATGGTTLSLSTTPTVGVQPGDVTPGSDGNIWFTELTGTAVGRLKLTQLHLLNVYYIPNRFFIPNIARLQHRGDTVSWLVLAPGTRGVLDTTGLNLYGSTPAGGPTQTKIGAIFSFTFQWAGTYGYDDPFHTASHGRVSVPISATRAAGTTSVANVTWASGDAPGGDVFDVQVEAPGSSSFVPWRTGTTALDGSFGPADPLWAGTGSYRFRARLRNVSSGAASGFSALRAIALS